MLARDFTIQSPAGAAKMLKARVRVRDGGLAVGVHKPRFAARYELLVGE